MYCCKYHLRKNFVQIRYLENYLKNKGKKKTLVSLKFVLIFQQEFSKILLNAYYYFKLSALISQNKGYCFYSLLIYPLKLSNENSFSIYRIHIYYVFFKLFKLFNFLCKEISNKQFMYFLQTRKNIFLNLLLFPFFITVITYIRLI